MTGGGEAAVEGGVIDRRAYLYVSLMVLIGSSTALAARFAARELPVGLLPIVRFGVAGLCLLPAVWHHRGGAFAAMIRRDRLRLLASAALCVPINQWFFLNGAKLAPTSHVAIIYATCPMVVLALAVAVRQERADPARLVGVLASVLGVALIALTGLAGGGAERARVLQGDLFLVVAVASWGAYLTVSKPLIARHGALPALAATFLVGALLDLPIALATMPGWPPLLLAASTAAWLGLAYLTLVVSVVGLACQNLAMRRLDASQVATFGNAGPVLTIALGAWLFREPITPWLMAGAALTLGGVLWTGRPRAA